MTMTTKCLLVVALLVGVAPSCGGKVVANDDQLQLAEAGVGGTGGIAGAANGGAGGVAGAGGAGGIAGAPTGGAGGVAGSATGGAGGVAGMAGVAGAGGTAGSANGGNGGMAGTGVGGSAGVAGAAGSTNPCYTKSVDLSKCSWVKSDSPKDIILAKDLHYPGGLWVEGCKVYIMEMSGRSTVYAGHLRLSEFDLETMQSVVLVDHPMGAQSVVMGSDGLLYLSSWTCMIPGDTGIFTKVNPLTCAEEVVSSLEIASEDAFTDDSGDILIAGSTWSPGGKSIQILRKGHYDAPDVLAKDLGLCRALSRDSHQTTWFVCDTSLYRMPANGPWSLVDPNVGYWHSISLSATNLYYLGLGEGTLARRPIDGFQKEILVDGLTEPLVVRYSAALNAVFFVDGGTDGAKYHDGTLHVLTGAE